MDGLLVWSTQYHQSGTSMPSGAVQPIFPGCAEGADPESRDSPMCNCTSEVRCFASPRNDSVCGDAAAILFRCFLHAQYRAMALDLRALAAEIAGAVEISSQLSPDSN